MKSTPTNESGLHELLDNAPCGFMIFTDDGIIKEINNTLLVALGYTREDLIGNKFDTLLNIAGKIFYQTHFFPLITLQGKAEEIFLTLIGKDNKEVPVLINGKRTERNSVYENHCVIMPVQHRKKFEEELILARRAAEDALTRNELLLKTTDELEQNKIELDRQITKLSMMNKDLVQFSNIISHDMQEPIRKIAMFADIVHRENHADLSEVSSFSIEKIKSSSRHMRDLISSLQQYVTVDTATEQPNLCDLNDIVTGARLKAMSDKHDQEVNVSKGLLPAVEGFCHQFELLFYHLISNSIQFKKQNGQTEISIEADIIQQNSFRAIKGKYRYIDFARITMSDKGQGFSNEYNEYVFQLFKKAHPDTQGLGIGLSLCKKIVENHYGSITASANPGEGASFTILLPLKHSWAAVG